MEKVDNINAYQVISSALQKITEDCQLAHKRAVEADALGTPLDPKLPTVLEELQNYHIWKLTLCPCLSSAPQQSHMPVQAKNINLQVILPAPTRHEFPGPPSTFQPPVSAPNPSTSSHSSTVQSMYTHYTDQPIQPPTTHPSTTPPMQTFSSPPPIHNSPPSHAALHSDLGISTTPQNATSNNGEQKSNDSDFSQSSMTQFGDLTPPTLFHGHGQVLDQAMV